MSIALTRGSRKAAKPAGVPIVQSRIAPSGVATIAPPNSGAMVSTSLIRRSSCSTLSRCRLVYGLALGTCSIIWLTYMRTTGSLSISSWNSVITGWSTTCSPRASDPFPVPGQPRLQVVLVFGQPAGPAPHVHSMRKSRHRKKRTGARPLSSRPQMGLTPSVP